MQFCDVNIFFRALNPADVFGQTASYLLRMGAHILHVRSSSVCALEFEDQGSGILKRIHPTNTAAGEEKKKSHKGEMVERRAKTCCS